MEANGDLEELELDMVRRVETNKLAQPSDSSTLLADAPLSFELEVPHRPEPTGKWCAKNSMSNFRIVSRRSVVGVGVLGLPYSFSYLTFGGGIFWLVLCTAASLYTSYLLAALHEERDGTRHNRYGDLGKAVLGRRLGTWLVGPFQIVVMVGLCITYAVTAGQSLQAVFSPECNGHTAIDIVSEAHQALGCRTALTWFIAGFGLLQCFLSLLPDFHSLWWVSSVGACMSACYSTIAFVSSAVAVKGTADFAVRPGSSADQIFGVFNSIGSCIFAFGGQAISLEIQATLATPPASVVSMMRGLYLANAIVVAAYFPVAITGYAAFGNAVDPDVLLSVSKPEWLIRAANFMVVIHLTASYQVFAQPVFESLEATLLARCCRRNPSKEPVPLGARVPIRSAFVIATAIVAIGLPFFSQLMGLIGAFSMGPMSFIMPPVLWLCARRPRGLERWLNIAIIVIFSMSCLLAGVGSLRNIILSAQNYHLGS